MAPVAVAGEALTDLVPAGDGLFRAAPGGSPANVAVGLARLGIATYFAARLSADPFGRRLRAHLEANGVDLALAVAAAEPSALAIVTLDERGGGEYDFRVAGAADWQWTDTELDPVAAVRPGALHIGSLAVTMEPGASALRRLVERVRDSTTVCLDPNVRPALMGEPDAVRARLQPLIRLADVVKASSEDVAWLYPGVSPEEQVHSWLAAGPAVAAVTCGADGVLAAGAAAGLVRRPGAAIEVVDTIGAGDSFMSALIAGLSRRGALGGGGRERLRNLPAETLSEVLDEAVRASAITCTRAGADPPTREELERTAG